MTVSETVEVLEANGWRLVGEENDLRQLAHDSKGKLVTLAGKLDIPVPPGVLQSVLRFAQVEHKS